MKKSLGLITVALCLMFALLLFQGYFVIQTETQARDTAHATQGLLVAGREAAVAQAKLATESSREATRIITKVENQLEDILAHSHSNEVLSSDVRTILCDTLVFDEKIPSVAALAKQMVKQSCGAVTLPTTTTTTTTTTVPHAAAKHHKTKKTTTTLKRHTQ